MKFARLLTITAALALVAGTTAMAGQGKGDGPRGGKGPGAMRDHLLPPRLVENLNLTDAQKVKYDALEAAFKTEANAWEKAHPNFEADIKAAREDGDKDKIHEVMQQRRPLMEARKGYVDQFRNVLTEEQRAKLDEARERIGKGPRGPKPEGAPRRADKPGQD